MLISVVAETTNAGRQSLATGYWTAAQTCQSGQAVWA